MATMMIIRKIILFIKNPPLDTYQFYWREEIGKLFKLIQEGNYLLHSAFILRESPSFTSIGLPINTVILLKGRGIKCLSHRLPSIIPH